MFCRIPSAYTDSVDYFALSGLTLRDIVDWASKSGQAVAEGVIYYLDEKLLRSDEPVKVSEVGRFLGQIQLMHNDFFFKSVYNFWKYLAYLIDKLYISLSMGDAVA